MLAMDLELRDLNTLSRLGYAYRETADGSVLVVSFSGTYGAGSQGNDDGIFISAVTLAGLAAFGGGCLVLDFTEMDYRWGNTLLKVFDDVSQYMDEPGVATYPVLVVTSDRSRDAFLSLVGKTEATSTEWHFRDLAAALGAARLAAQRWCDS